MKNYLLTVLGTTLLSAFVTAIIPEGKTTATIKGATKTICLLVIVSPILTFLQKTGKFTENTFVNLEESVISTNDEFIKYYSELRIKETESLLKTELLEKFAQETEIKMDWSFENYKNVENLHVKINKITISVTSNVTEQEKENIKLYVTKYYCSEVLIE